MRVFGHKWEKELGASWQEFQHWEVLVHVPLQTGNKEAIFVLLHWPSAVLTKMIFPGRFVCKKRVNSSLLKHRQNYSSHSSRFIWVFFSSSYFYPQSPQLREICLVCPAPFVKRKIQKKPHKQPWKAAKDIWANFWKVTPESMMNFASKMDVENIPFTKYLQWLRVQLMP